MSLSATNYCDLRPGKSKPTSREVLFQSGQRLKLIIEQLRFHTLCRKSLYLETLLNSLHALSALSISRCWLATGGPDSEKPVALRASHMPTNRGPLALLADPHPLPLVLEPKQFVPKTAATPWAHLSLCSLRCPPILRHHWNSHSRLFLCNYPRIYSCSAILLFWRRICILGIFQKFIFFLWMLSHLPTICFFRSLIAEKLRI